MEPRPDPREAVGWITVKPGTSRTSTAWRCRRATSCSSSTSPRGGSRASSTSAAPNVFLGVPFNISSYSLLTMMIAQVTGLEPGEFVLTLGDTHLYLNHLGQADTQLEREPYPLPRMVLNPTVGSMTEFTYDDFTLVGYEHHPRIKAPIAV